MGQTGKSHGQLVSLERAQELVRGLCVPMHAEELSLLEAGGRVLAAPVIAVLDQPQSDISMMDGYALVAADAESPLRVAFEIAAGDAPASRALGRGEAARIFTGAPVPPGADCVAMQEHCLREGDLIQLQKPAQPGQHVRRRGEEMRAGAQILPAGTQLRGAELALAASAGAIHVSLRRKPRVAILATGDELLPLGSTPPPGKLVETNSLQIAQLVREAGADPILLGIVGDAPGEIASRLASIDAEILITTGGASVGDHDHAQAAVELLPRGQIVFHGLAVRPGKPSLFATADGLHSNDAAPRKRLIFGLPGNPAASMLCFELLVRPALRTLLGLVRWDRPHATAKLVSGSLGRVPGLTFFPRGHAQYRDGQLEFRPASQQSSMQIGSWSAVNAVAVIEAGEGKLEPGAQIEILLLSLD